MIKVGGSGEVFSNNLRIFQNFFLGCRLTKIFECKIKILANLLASRCCTEKVGLGPTSMAHLVAFLT
jgi:hypothetical protein